MSLESNIVQVVGGLLYVGRCVAHPRATPKPHVKALTAHTGASSRSGERRDDTLSSLSVRLKMISFDLKLLRADA